MDIKVDKDRIQLVKGDITKLDVDAIVNAANSSLLGGGGVEDGLLADCYINSLKLAVENNIKSIAFPNISTGVYGFPKDRAADIAVTAVSRYLDVNESVEKVIFVCFDEENYNLYSKLLG